MTDFDVYKIYLALKLHFTSEYDYVKYNGKVNATVTSYNKRKDHFFFKKLSRIYNKEQVEHFFVSNFIENEKMWIGDSFSPECMGTYKNWQKKIESLQYTFKNDCNVFINLIGNDETKFDNLFAIQNGQHPTILKIALAKKINLETFIILNSIFKFAVRFNKEISDPIIWPEFFTKCKNYRPFLEYDVDKYIRTLKKVLDI